MNSGIDPWTKILLLKAAEDEATIQIEELPDGPFGFHAQQAVEKLMKALLSQLSIGLDYTHNVENLARQLSDAGETVPAKHARLTAMNRFAVAYRYDAIPDPEIQGPVRNHRHRSPDTGAHCGPHFHALRRALAPSATIVESACRTADWSPRTARRIRVLCYPNLSLKL